LGGKKAAASFQKEMYAAILLYTFEKLTGVITLFQVALNPK